MRVLIVHNYYMQRGGEDAVFESESALLAAAGHDTATLAVSNTSVLGSHGVWPLARTAAGTLWSRDGAALVSSAARRHAAEVVHFHNTFPLLSPAAYHAAHEVGAAVVQTLHNYRIGCPKAVFFRDGSVCEDCLGRRVPWPAVQHACYRDSHLGSAVVASMLALHRGLGTWRHEVDRYVALTEFQLAKMVESGLPPERLAVSPNAVLHDPGTGTHHGGLLYVGRLSEEKGVGVLLEAWRQHQLTTPLRIVGDGPLIAELSTRASALDAVEVVGPLPHEQVLDEMKRASALVFPSVWYEGCPMTILEAFATGLPVITSRIGGLPDIVEEGESGWLFEPGNPDDLARVVRDVAADPTELRRLQTGARTAFEQRFSSEQLSARLTSIFEAACYQRDLASA